MKHRCPTCPFNPEGKGYTEYRALLEERALTECTPICHSTGDSDLTPLNKKISPINHACRGARDLQIKLFHALGFLKEPTDAEWTRKCEEMGLI